MASGMSRIVSVSEPFPASDGLQEAMLCTVQDVISQADVAAGLSLGEYTALTFAGALKCAHGSLLCCLLGARVK